VWNGLRARIWALEEERPVHTHLRCKDDRQSCSKERVYYMVAATLSTYAVNVTIIADRIQ
jgi:hypothetical protein